MKQVLPRAAGLALMAALVLAASSQARAQPAAGAGPERLAVGVHVHPPFVVEENGQYGGMVVELWEWLADGLGLEGEYLEFDTVAELVDAAAAGEIDVAVTNLSVTRARAERIEFTHPWFDAGQRIMIREAGGSGLRSVIAGLSDAGHLRAYGVLLALVLAATLVMTLFDRRFDPGFPSRWRDGLAESFYAVMSIAASGKSGRKNLFGWAGRIWQALWLACGIAVLAYVTSSVTSVMTTLSLTGRINSVADLPGHPVAVLPGSVSDQFALEHGFDARPYDHFDTAIDALLAGEVDAIIDDAPVLEYYAHTHPDRAVEVVGPIFAPDKYAFGLAQGSALRRPLSVELIGAREDGLIEALRETYFGKQR